MIRVGLHKMYFLLKSEVERIDFLKNSIRRKIYCPFCNKSMLKRLDSNRFYNKYQCWNRNCKNKDTQFAVLNEYIQFEDLFKTECDKCDKSYNREFIANGNYSILINFRCTEMSCKTYSKPYSYNVTLGEWEGVPPKFKKKKKLKKLKIDKKGANEKVKQNIQENNSFNNDLIETISENFNLTEIADHLRKIEEIPLLAMNAGEYDEFLEYHENKVVILVDLPNFVRTLRGIISFNFEQVLEKAHELLLEYIKNSFFISDEYIIRYFSKPDEDLELSNKIIVDFCLNNRDKEFFHLLKIPKGKGYSDIDNYLIANGVEILEKCKIRGFVIVSSDKDYLPVMRIASYKNIKSRILGINTPEIYKDYDIQDIKFLGIMKFFDIPSYN